MAASCFRIQARIGQQRVGQGLQTGFQRDLGLGAAFQLVRQIQIFEPGLVFGMGDRVQQHRRHLVLFLDRGDDRRPPRFQFAQVAQAFFQQAQLDVVQAAGGFLAVTGDERHGRAFVQQRDGGCDLYRFGSEFKGEALFDGWQHGQLVGVGNQAVMIRNPAGYASPDRTNCVESVLCFCYFIGSMSEKMAVAARIHWGVEIYMGVYSCCAHAECAARLVMRPAQSSARRHILG